MGRETALVSLPFDTGMIGGGSMGRGMMSGRGIGRGMMGGGRILPNGSGFPIFRIRVNRKEKETVYLPERLSTIERYKPEDTGNLRYPRTFHLLMRHMAWTINGRTFRMEEVANDEKVRMGSLEVWEFINRGGRMGMMGMINMPHPIHFAWKAVPDS